MRLRVIISLGVLLGCSLLSLEVYGEEASACLECHGMRGMSTTLGRGEELSLYVDQDQLRNSVHGDFECTDCHEGFSSGAHPRRKFQTRRDHRAASSSVCKDCHSRQYAATLKSVHYRARIQGNTEAPVCVDCHGSHSILPAREAKAETPPPCAKCHKETYNTYKKSVHGAARISQNNQDPAICTDCHGAHKIADPKTAEFHSSEPEICGRCHTEKELMKKYGISSVVVQTYSRDFHGVTLGLYKQEGKSKRVAVCTDCHGIHDIAKPPPPNSPQVHVYLAKKCQACHPRATDNFSGALIPHYQANFQRAPGVFSINLLYRIFIPLMVVGLFLQILLHIWRLALAVKRRGGGRGHEK